MKNYIVNIMRIFMMFLFCGCDNWIEGYDDDPNSTQEASIENLMTASQVNIFNFSENHLARSVSIWMQQMAGTDRQYKSLGLYTFEENDYSASWQSVYINGGLRDLKKIQLLANLKGNKGDRYNGIAKIMEAYLIGMAASIWGNIPYSETNNESISNPKLDEQASIYISIQNLLDSAIINLASDTTLVPQNDMFFNGDIDKWKAVAYTLKARFYMHWVEINISYCDSALENANKGISSLDGTLKSLHGTESSEQNMWYQFNQDRAGYMVAGANIINLLKGNNDPRDTIYFGKNDAGSIVGADPNGDSRGKSYLNEKYFGDDSPIDIISFEENLLIKSECYYLQDKISEAQQSLQGAQTAAEEKWGLNSDTFTDISITGLTLKKKILEEKYIALFLNIELWNDYKRNCYPVVKYKKSEDEDGNPIYSYPPRRVYYPEDERISNTRIPNISQQPLSNSNDPNDCSTSE